MKETLNLKFLLGMLLAVVVASGAWFLLHRFQVQNHAAALLEYARRMETEGRLDRSARFLGLYLNLKPTDDAARAQYAHVLDQGASSPAARRAAVVAYGQVLAHDPEQHDVRRRLALLCMSTGQLDEAIEHLTLLTKTFPEDADLAFGLGRCLDAQRKYEEAVRWFRQALRHAPGDLDLHRTLANLLRRRLDRAAEADQVMDRLVEANPQNFAARLTRAQYRKEHHLAGADDDLAEAVRLAPDEADVLLAAAELAEEKKQREQAYDYLRRGVQQYPQNGRFYQALASLELSSGHPKEAIACLREGCEKSPADGELLLNFANLLIENGDVAEAQRVIGQMSRLKLPAPQIDFLQARVRLRKGEWLEASGMLEGIRPLVVESDDLTAQVDSCLGQCYEHLGDIDKQLAAYRRAQSIHPFQVPVRAGIAAALLNLGRLEEAIDEYQHLLELPDAPPEGWLTLARLLILQRLRLPAAQRTWGPVEQALESSAKATPNAVALPILAAEMHAARKELDAARTVLDKAREAHPKSEELWVALADLAGREGKWDLAQQTLANAEKRLGDRVSLRLGRARVLTGQNGPDAVADLGRLAGGAERFAPEERAVLFEGLAHAYLELGKRDEARQLWARLVELRPKDLYLHLFLFDLALEAGDAAAMEQAIQAIRTLEGPSGSMGTFAQAQYLVRQAEKGDRALLQQARAELGSVAARRQGWSRVPLALAHIDELEGEPERAIEDYLRAIDLGEHQLDTIRRVVDLLNKRHRYADAALVIRKLPEQTPLFGDLQRLAAEVSLNTRDFPRALELARRAVPAESKNYEDHLWLGQIYWAVGQTADATKAFQRAVELAPQSPETWVSLVQHLSRTQRADEAEAVLVRARGALPEAEAPLALAQCYAAIDRPEQARKFFEDARRDKPDDPEVLRVAADFYLRLGDLREAEACLRKVIQLKARDPGEAAWARRMLAAVLAAAGDYQRSREALAVLGLLNDAPAVAAGSDDSGEEQRAKAVVLATQLEPAQQQEAIRILEALNQRQPLSEEDQFLLAQLYEKRGDTAKFRQRMQRLLVAAPGTPRYTTYLAAFVRALLKHRELGEAQLWLAKLEEQDHDGLGTLELQARVLAARGKGDEAVALLKSRVPVREARLALALGNLLEEIGQGSAAEELYRKYVAEAKQPESSLVLARYLGRRNRLSEALALCESAWQNCRPEDVGNACLEVLHAAPSGPEEKRRVERWLQAAHERDPSQTGLLVCLADLQDLSGQYEAATRLYQHALAQDAHSVEALNNLAWLLAVREGKGEAALGLVNQAIGVLGPIPELRDTRALAYLALGQLDKAKAELEQAVQLAPSPKVSAAIYFHLAEVQQRAGNEVAAKKAWQKAKEAGIETYPMHPLEEDAFHELSNALTRH